LARGLGARRSTGVLGNEGKARGPETGPWFVKRVAAVTSVGRGSGVQRSMRAEPPVARAFTSASEAIVVSPGKVVSSAP
jgi:hypothetical protein